MKVSSTLPVWLLLRDVFGKSPKYVRWRFWKVSFHQSATSNLKYRHSYNLLQKSYTQTWIESNMSISRLFYLLQVLKTIINTPQFFDICPKFTSSILVFQCSFSFRSLEIDSELIRSRYKIEKANGRHFKTRICDLFIEHKSEQPNLKFTSPCVEFQKSEQPNLFIEHAEEVNFREIPLLVGYVQKARFLVNIAIFVQLDGH